MTPPTDTSPTPLPSQEQQEVRLLAWRLGESTSPEEILEIKNWLNTNDQLQAYSRQLDDLLPLLQPLNEKSTTPDSSGTTLSQKTPTLELSQERQTILNLLFQTPPPLHPPSAQTPTPRFLLRFPVHWTKPLGIAAGIMLTLGGFLSWNHFTQKSLRMAWNFEGAETDQPSPINESLIQEESTRGFMNSPASESLARGTSATPSDSPNLTSQRTPIHLDAKQESSSLRRYVRQTKSQTQSQASSLPSSQPSTMDDFADQATPIDSFGAYSLAEPAMPATPLPKPTRKPVSDDLAVTLQETASPFDTDQNTHFSNGDFRPSISAQTPAPVERLAKKTSPLAAIPSLPQLQEPNQNVEWREHSVGLSTVTPPPASSLALGVAPKSSLQQALITELDADSEPSSSHPGANFQIMPTPPPQPSKGLSTVVPSRQSGGSDEVFFAGRSSGGAELEGRSSSESLVIQDRELSEIKARENLNPNSIPILGKLFSDSQVLADKEKADRPKQNFFYFSHDTPSEPSFADNGVKEMAQKKEAEYSRWVQIRTEEARAGLEAVDRAWLAPSPENLPNQLDNKDALLAYQLDSTSPALEAKLMTRRHDSSLEKTEVPSNTLTPKPEISTANQPFSTFSLNVSDVAFKLALESLERGTWPSPSSLRSEEFINAMNYHDPAPLPGSPIAFTWERAHYPFYPNREVLRLSFQTASQGRLPNSSLNLVLLVDVSGSMERADRSQILRLALQSLAQQLLPSDVVSVITFARTAQLRADGIPGTEAESWFSQMADLHPEGGTNLEMALDRGYQTALRHYQPSGMNRIVLLTDGAANLGNVNETLLREKVVEHRKKGIALDCFGIGWEGYNDPLLERLARNGDGRYAYLNHPEEATSEFVDRLVGAFQVAASDVKVQIEFNPRRVQLYRQVGYDLHQLKTEDFRDNSVDAAELGGEETGTALYVLQVDPNGSGDLGTAHVRYLDPNTQDYRELEWSLPYRSSAIPLEKASPATRLAVGAATLAEWMAKNPYAASIQPGEIQQLVLDIPQRFAPDPLPNQLLRMIQLARSLSGQ